MSMTDDDVMKDAQLIGKPYTRAYTKQGKAKDNDKEAGNLAGRPGLVSGTYVHRTQSKSTRFLFIPSMLRLSASPPDAPDQRQCLLTL
jgi:hypothetical protein